MEEQKIQASKIAQEKSVIQVEDESGSYSARYACCTCHKPAPDRKNLKRCGRCKSVWYCSSECQMKDWKEHRPYCTQTNQASALMDSGSADTEEQKIQASHKVQEKSALRIDESQCEEDAAPMVYACYTCHASDDSRTLKCCSRCKVAWYCSSECQTKDWKEHKNHCAQMKYDPQVFLSMKDQFPGQFVGCPSPVPGYIRTAALEQQIFFLSHPHSLNQNTDYHFVIGPKRTRALILPNCAAKLDFLVARRRAMACGSISAVHKMLTIIEDFAPDSGYGLNIDQIRRQLEIEYSVTIDASTIDSAEPWTTPTAQEDSEEQLYLRTRMANAEQ
ncbi:hypothetical protein BT96DRAFT_922196 [Gymnopus androsaceus JB14]|uniref:MYND-type domain-containing protein n=1 Tax=Gymnopus androsaceus JB14 TaxID=1447944 RepID=A0A6A4HEV1_9AGAR|nr:hypothetical protein BT96DRAFT_922196 [Gymnopus androsaceus JB14]